MTKVAECEGAIYELIALGKAEQVKALCETEPCSNVAYCQKYLGWAYYKQNDLEKSLLWFARAAKQDDGEALFGIGSICVVRKDYRSALQYFEKAVARGYARAYQWIGGIYQHGCGVPVDINKATLSYQLGAAHGFIMAKRSLINIASQRGGIVIKIGLLPKLICLYFEIAKIVYSNVNDPRIVDIQNVFEKRIGS